jgi:uncharacterized protein (TIGR03437 family)
MRSFAAAVFTCLLSAASLMALVPGITSVQNPASNALPGLPTYGIAQGSIFIIYGSQLGPSSIVVAPSLPYQTTLAGTSVTITAGGYTTSAPVIYTLGTQVAAVMPSATVVGPATVTVAYNGFKGTPFNATVVANQFGLSTVNETGSGMAVVTDANYRVTSYANSTVPGNTYTIWGTGLGAATGGNTDTGLNVFASVGPQPTVWIGGVSANVTYYGRSPGAGPGLDQINFTIPQGVSGCYVSLVIQFAGSPVTVSNGTTIPIAANGGLCSDANGVPASTWQPLLSLSGGANIAIMGLSELSTTTYSNGKANPTTTGTGVTATFMNYTQAQLQAQYSTIGAPAASSGSCVVAVTLVQSAAPTQNSTGLDAGLSVSFNSFTGTALQLAKIATGSYLTTGSTFFPAGNYNFTDGAGGTGVGPIGSIAFSVPAFATWTNQTAISGSTITRANGLTVTWSGAPANSYVDIQGAAGFGANGTNTITLNCAAPGSAGTFTIPAWALLAMPVGNGTMQFTTQIQQQVTVPGMNFAGTYLNNITNVGVSWN